MPLGPYDRRNKRSRCVECFQRHLKCSGDPVCQSCAKKGLVCLYESAKSKRALITIDNGRQLTTAVYEKHANRQQASQRVSIIDTPKSDPNSLYISFFDIFLQKNKFSGHSSVSADVQALVRSSPSASGGYLMDAMVCLGAMEAIKLQKADLVLRRQYMQMGMGSYSRSISGLRRALSNEAVKHQKDTVLWATLFLGLFEVEHFFKLLPWANADADEDEKLMMDPTGQGWLQHIIHGTSHALLASGPQAFESGIGERFFSEMKIFEVSRSIIFNEPTFLVTPDWINLSARLRAKREDHVWRALDELLDTIVFCSTLRVRASEFIRSPEESRSFDDALAISEEGIRLRVVLSTWHATWSPSLHSKADTLHGFDLLAQAFHAACSIYLSGVFDYEITHWQALDLPVPELQETVIQEFVNTILSSAGQILASTDISPVLLMFPLRVAGSRCRTHTSQQSVLTLLSRIESTFAVAAAFRSDLSAVWAFRRASSESFN